MATMQTTGTTDLFKSHILSGDKKKENIRCKKPITTSFNGKITNTLAHLLRA